MQDLPDQLANGLALGALYGLIAIGYTMVYGIVQLINFAHGEIFMIGGFGALTAHLWLPARRHRHGRRPPPDDPPRRRVRRPRRHRRRTLRLPAAARGGPRLSPLITAIGLSLALQQAVWAFYPEAKKARPFPQLGGGDLDLGFVALSREDLFIFVSAPVCMLALGLFVAKTRTGRAMQATSQDPDTAKLMGVNTDRIIVMAFAIGAAFAAVAAIAQGFKTGEVNFRMGFIAGLKAFTAAVLGGIGNIYGAMVGGLVLGVGEAMATAYIGDIPGLEQFGGGSWKDVWAFILLILVLLVRPQGILGERLADRA